MSDSGAEKNGLRTIFYNPADNTSQQAACKAKNTIDSIFYELEYNIWGFGTVSFIDPQWVMVLGFRIISNLFKYLLKNF
jgi:hypothetical protein